MARGVAYPKNYEHLAFIDVSKMDEFDFDYLIEEIKHEFKRNFKSLWDSDEWFGDELKVILENRFVQIGISEYMGIMALWLVVKENDYENLAYGWLRKVGKKMRKIFDKYNELIHIGTFSNGEHVYKRIKR